MNDGLESVIRQERAVGGDSHTTRKPASGKENVFSWQPNY
jgi:hypothetical protein